MPGRTSRLFRHPKSRAARRAALAEVCESRCGRARACSGKADQCRALIRRTDLAASRSPKVQCCDARHSTPRPGEAFPFAPDNRRSTQNLKGNVMSISAARGISIAITASLLCLSNLTYAQSEPPQPEVRPAPVESCWRPGMARNIGIAELVCDVPMPRPRPVDAPR